MKKNKKEIPEQVKSEITIRLSVSFGFTSIAICGLVFFILEVLKPNNENRYIDIWISALCAIAILIGVIVFFNGIV